MRAKTPELDNRILDAAARLFAGNHFHEVRMEDISSEAEVGKGTLYRYFADKEELYLALLARAARQMQALVNEVLADVDGAGAKLRALAAAVLHFFDEQPHIFELIQQAEATYGTNHPWQAARDALNAIVRELFAEAKASGEFEVANPEEATLLLLGGLRAISRFAPKPLRSGAADRVVETILFGAARRT